MAWSNTPIRMSCCASGFQLVHSVGAGVLTLIAVVWSSRESWTYVVQPAVRELFRNHERHVDNTE